jgi:large subunit ribosomal protein L31e
MAEKTKPAKKEASIKQEEKVLVVPLRARTKKSPRGSRMKHSVSEIRSFLSRHMKADPSDISISQQLNESLMRKGFHRPPAKVKIKVSTDEEGRVFAKLLDEKEKSKIQKKKGLRERLTGRRESSKEGKPEEKREAKPDSKPEVSKAEAKKEEKPEAGNKQKPKEAPAEELDQDILLEK